MRYFNGMLLAGLVCLGACRGGTAPAPTAAAPTVDPTPASIAAAPTTEAAAPAPSTAVAALEGRLTKGMAYADLRKAVLAQGWLPQVTPECAEHVGGEAAICRQLPELDACSGDGRCTMRFAHDAEAPTLRVDTSGDYLQWQATGAQATLLVDAWSFEPVAAASAAPCPANDFAGFLAAFAADDKVQRAHTAPLVRVMQSWDVGEDTTTFASYEPAADYTGFRFDHAADGFHVVGADGRADPTPTKLDIVAEAGGAYRVSYRYGMSEGNSYRFERSGGCWTLVGDPQAPTP